MEVIEKKGFKMLPARPGRCAMCNSNHRADQPHDVFRPFYQRRFKLKWGRPPTWADARAHLTEERTANWRRKMESIGHEWTEPADGKPIREPYALVEA